MMEQKVPARPTAATKNMEQEDAESAKKIQFPLADGSCHFTISEKSLLKNEEANWMVSVSLCFLYYLLFKYLRTVQKI